MIWTWNVLGLHNFVQAAYEPIMVRPMPEKTNVLQLPLCHVYYVRILLVNGKVCMYSQLLVKAWNNQY